MADNSVLGLFTDPFQYVARQNEMQDQSARRFAEMTPLQQAQYGIYKGAGQLGGGLAGLMGVQDPQLQMMTNRTQLARQFDVNTPQGLAQYANALRQSGDVQGALQATTLASQLAGTQAESALSQEKLASTRISGQREQELQSALSQLPENASEQQIQAVLRRYGDPKVVLQALERKTNLDAQLAERRKIEEDRNQLRRDMMEKDQEFKREMASLSAQMKAGTTALQQQLIQEKIDALRQKKQDAIDKQLGTAQGVIENTQVVLGKIKEAEKLIGAGTTGVGSYLSVLPGTDARELSTVIGTIKARLGFDQLQQMRNASPTGGALGQVSNRELAALEGALASLDQGLSPQALRANLKQIEKSYKRWQETATGKLPEGTTPSVDGAGKVVDFNSLQ